MAKSLRVPVKKEVWLWAIRESQKDPEEISKRYPSFNKWINGEQYPTFRQLEKIAKYLHVPFGYFFLDVPPKKDAVEAEFRVINNKLPQMSKNLKDTILEMDFRKNWMSDYRKNLGWEKLDIIADFKAGRTGDVAADAHLARKLLDLTENWYEQVRDYDAAYNHLKEKLENAGILVMQNSVVGMNNYRRLDINEFRAFMLYDDVAPLIFINRNDTKAGMIFSLIHEYFHVLYEQEDLFIDMINNEQEMNRLTAEFLMPAVDIKQRWGHFENPLERIEELCQDFKVSRLALAIKLEDLGLINQSLVELIKTKSLKDFETSRESTGSLTFYPTYKSRISTAFREAVVTSAEAGDIEYTYAFKLLGLKGRAYNTIRDEIMAYE